MNSNIWNSYIKTEHEYDIIKRSTEHPVRMCIFLWKQNISHTEGKHKPRIC